MLDKDLFPLDWDYDDSNDCDDDCCDDDDCECEDCPRCGEIIEPPDALDFYL